MNENQSGSGNLLDTTDCLEAVGVFKGWKNFFFIIILLSILLLQACFWLSDTGLILISQKALSDSNSIQAESKTESVIQEPNATPEQENAVEPNQLNQIENPMILAAETTIPSPNDLSSTTSSEKGILFGVTFEQIYWIIRFVNAILILTAVLYCLTMLFSLKLSMLGRLGGINHITKAFFLSLIMLIIILPWQKVFDSVILGAVFTPDEFVEWHAEKTSDMMNLILYYMRFCGYQVLVFLFLILAQIRSCRWAKAILRTSRVSASRNAWIKRSS